MKTISTLIAVLACSHALASTDVQQRLAAQASGTVEISNVAGSVHVKGWRREQVEVSGTLGDGVERLEFESRGDRTVVKVHLLRDGFGRKDGSAKLTVMVPQRSRLEVNLVSASLEVEGVGGNLDLNTVSGAIRIDGAGGGRVTARSVSGSIEYAGPLVRDGRYEMETVSGRIALLVQGKPDATFDLSSFSGSIRNEFGPDAERTSRYVPGLALRFDEGSGSADIRMRSLSGLLELRRK